MVIKKKLTMITVPNPKPISTSTGNFTHTSCKSQTLNNMLRSIKNNKKSFFNGNAMVGFTYLALRMRNKFVKLPSTTNT